MIGFESKRSVDDFYNSSFSLLEGELNNTEIVRLKKIRKCWNFYEGYHWEEVPEEDGPQLTINYCRAFVNKIVSFEMGKAFSFTVPTELEKIPVTKDGRSTFDYLEDVWEDNNQYRMCIELGQMKSVTGEAWLQVRYDAPEDINDPFSKYPDGRVRVILMPTETVWPEYDPHDKDKLVRVTIMYTYKKIVRTGILGKRTMKDVLYKQIWTEDKCVVIDGADSEPVEYVNKYKCVPFVCIKNTTIACRNEGYGDLDDVIPMNLEYDMKSSDVSEIIDYHAAPITVVYGAKIGNLEKGANKMWGGLAKDAKVENLELKGDLALSTNFISDLKKSMCEVGGIPENVLGGSQGVSNTSGVALQYMNLPLIEKCNQKRMNTEDGLETVNSLILLVSICEGLVTKPEGIEARDLFHTEVSIPDTLPKDEIIELQKIQLEMRLGLECRENAMKRMGKENITEIMKKVDEDMKAHPEFYGVPLAQPPVEGKSPQLNSGLTNGSTPIEELRKEVTGQNGGAQLQ